MVADWVVEIFQSEIFTVNDVISILIKLAFNPLLFGIKVIAFWNGGIKRS